MENGNSDKIEIKEIVAESEQDWGEFKQTSDGNSGLSAEKIKKQRKREYHIDNEETPCPVCKRNQAIILRVEPRINKKGYVILRIKSDPECIVTLGLNETYGFPELIVVDYHEPDFLVTVVEKFIKYCLITKQFCEGNRHILKLEDSELPIGIKPILKKEKLYYMILANHKYGRNGYQAVQLIIPDDNDRLPWDEKYNVDSGSRYLLYRHCWNCLKTEVEFFSCSKCNHATYCGTSCQKANWKFHKTQCEELGAYHKLISEI